MGKRLAGTPTRALCILAWAGLLAMAGCVGPPGDAAPQDGAPAADPGNFTVSKEVFEGSILCGAGAGPLTTNPCAPVADKPNIVGFSVSAGIQTLLVGLTWDPETPLGERLLLYLETDPYMAAFDVGHRYHVASGGPDLVFRIDTAGMDADDWSFARIDGSLDLMVRVFPDGTLPPTILIDQGWELHLVEFYGAPAPPDADPFAMTG